MKYHQFIRYGLGLCTLILVMGSCRSQKTALKPAKTVRNVSVQQILKEQPDFKSLYIKKMRLKVTSGSHTYNVTGRLELIKDSMLTLTVMPFFGIEAYRMICYTDHFEVYNKLKGKYAVAPYSFLEEATEIPGDYYLLQAGFSNQLFLMTGTNTRDLNRVFSEVQGGDTTTIVSSEEIFHFKHYFQMNEDHRIIKTFVGEEHAPRFFIGYSDFERHDGQKFPMRVVGRSLAAKSDIKVDIAIKGLEFNHKTIQLPPLDTQRYTLTLMQDVGKLF